MNSKKRPHEFFEVHKDENLIREQRYRRMRTGHEKAPEMRARQRARIARIKAIVQDFANRQPLDYLEDLSWSNKLESE